MRSIQTFVLAIFFIVAAVATSPVNATDLIGGEAPKMLTPEEALKTFSMAEGYQINLWASEVETEIESPAGMTFDSQGRLWVSCVASQPHAKPDEKPRDSIVVLEDTDHDGVADKSTVFYDELYLPMGLTVADGGKTVYVASEPNLLKLTDTDGDLKADEVEIMMHGFGTEDNHHYISAFQWAPDGRLHFGQGLFLNTQVETPHGPLRAFEGTIFRLDPRDHRLEVHSSFGFSNPWGIIFGKWGEPLLADASPAMDYYLTHMSSRFDYPKQDKYANYTKKRGGFSFTPNGRRPSCGNEILAHEHWPEEVRGWYTNNQMKGWHGVRWYKMNQEGSGYSTEQPYLKEGEGEGSGELLSCSDITFRPVAQQIGPDGALYILDYYNPIVGHTTYSFRDPRRIQTHGRVWRVTAKDRPTPWQPEIRTAENEALLELLLSPNERWGYHARRELQQREQKAVLEAADVWQVKHKGNDHALTEVLWLYQNFNDPQPKRLGRLLASRDHDARTAAVRILRHWQSDLPEAQTLPMLEAAITDSNQRVRLEAMIAAGFHPNSGAVIAIAAKALDLEMDHGFELAARETLGYLSENVAAVPPSVGAFLLPNLSDEELLTRGPTPENAGEILARPSIAVDEKRSALRVLGKPEGRESIDQLFYMLGSDAPGREISEGKIENLLLSWDAASLVKKADPLKQLASKTKTSNVRNAALAVLLRQKTAPEPGIPPAQWIAAMPQAGRGKIDESWLPLVTENVNGTGAARMNAIKALPLFSAHDKTSAATFAKIATENKESNITLAFAALDALKRIPKAAWPENSEHLNLTKIRISATANLRFDPDQFTVPPGSAVELSFYNPDNLYHNLAIVDLGALDRVGLAADIMAGKPDGLQKNYIPDDPGVLHATPQLTIGSARSHVLRFFAPEESGEYPYICTYPGHWRAMRGSMFVVENR